jgi:hypothetical protein
VRKDLIFENVATIIEIQGLKGPQRPFHGYVDQWHTLLVSFLIQLSQGLCLHFLDHLCLGQQHYF